MQGYPGMTSQSRNYSPNCHQCLIPLGYRWEQRGVLGSLQHLALSLELWVYDREGEVACDVQMFPPNTVSGTQILTPRKKQQPALSPRLG